MTDCRVILDTNKYYDEVDAATAEFEMWLLDPYFKQAYEIYLNRVGGLSTITDYDIAQIEKIKETL